MEREYPPNRVDGASGGYAANKTLAGTPRPPWGDPYAGYVKSLHLDLKGAQEHLNNLSPAFYNAERVVADLQRAINALENG